MIDLNNKTENSSVLRTRCAAACVGYALYVLFSPVLAENPSVDEAQDIAEEAYIYAYPLLQNYKTMYTLSVAGIDGKLPRPFNTFFHRRKLLGPEYSAIVGPNNDTLYSSAWLDLRHEPLIVSVPAVPENRYYALQFVDAYVHNFAYIGQRTTGDHAGNYAIYGRNHERTEHPDIVGSFVAESDFVFIIGRTLVRDQEDVGNVLAIQDNYLITPLSEFAGVPAPALAKTVAFPEYNAEKSRSHGFIEYFNFLLSHVDIHTDDQDLFERFEKIGIRSQRSSATLTDSILAAIDKGVASAHQKIRNQSLAIGTRVNGWNTTFAGFGPRESATSRHLLRAAAAMLALYGNNREENSGFSRTLDAAGLALDGSSNRYSLTFETDQLPPTNAFWSLTMYRLPELRLVHNDANRYSVGDRTDDLQLDQDGSLTIYLQYEAPAEDRLSNWLPAPDGPFALSLRIYLPKENVLDGTWIPPQIVEDD